MTRETVNDAELADEQEYPPFMSPTAVRRMTVAVVVMGVILLVGFATLVGLIIYKSGKAKKAAIADAQPAVVRVEEAQAAYGVTGAGKFVAARIPKGARITGTTVDGDRVFLTIEDGSGSALMMFDAKSWRVLGVARFSSDANAVAPTGD